MNDRAIANFFGAAGDLLAAGLDQLKATDQDAFEELYRAVASGAKLNLHVVFGKDGALQTICTANLNSMDMVLFELQAGAPIWQ